MPTSKELECKAMQGETAGPDNPDHMLEYMLGQAGKNNQVRTVEIVS